MNNTLIGYLPRVNGHTRPTFSVGEWRDRSALIAEQTADLAEELASILEESARRGDSYRRLRLAETERQIAAIQRRNAIKLGDTDRGAGELEHLPSLDSD
jgi:hypothetical protein